MKFFVWAALAALAILTTTRDAAAYPWMIRHGYGACAACHADPSGAGLLTVYGRAQSELLLSTRYRAPAEEEEPSSFQRAFFGLLPLPSNVLIGGWVRNGYLWNTRGGNLVDNRFLQMRADLGAQVTLGRFRASGTIGFARAESAPFAQQAWVTTSKDGPNLVSREHWLGFDAVEDKVLVRAGRINLPFGLRNLEHTSWVRAETRTDYNQGQSHGAAVSYTGESFRGEAMAIAGNYQQNPDRYRERGLSAFGEVAFGSHAAFGVSTLFVHADADIGARKEVFRQAHGVHGRLSFWKPLVFLAEGDALVSSLKTVGTKIGWVGFFQQDFEIIQGVHGMFTLEALRRPTEGAKPGFGAWLSAAWFFLPHFDIRGDIIRRSGLDAPATTSYLAQLHGYL